MERGGSWQSLDVMHSSLQSGLSRWDSHPPPNHLEAEVEKLSKRSELARDLEVPAPSSRSLALLALLSTELGAQKVLGTHSTVQALELH